MKKHKHKESYSVLFISNTDKSSRQFHISRSTIRFVFFIQFLIIIIAVSLALLFSMEFKESQKLHTQINELEQQLETVKAEKESLSNKINTLEAENSNLAPSSETTVSETETEQETTEAEDDPSLPSLFPSSDVSVVISKYSTDQPYLSFNTNTGNNVVATGDGTLTAISSDDVYPVIIEIDHANGYITRYMCRQPVDLQLEEGTQVSAGDILCTIITDSTQLDYQVALNNTTIDPFDVIAAKG